MEIRVYKQNPQGPGRIEIGNFPPDEFFPLRKRRKP